jgi:hypothetical protein
MHGLCDLSLALASLALVVAVVAALWAARP